MATIGLDVTAINDDSKRTKPGFYSETGYLSSATGKPGIASGDWMSSELPREVGGLESESVLVSGRQLLQPIISDANLQINVFSGVWFEDDLTAIGDQPEGADQVAQRI